jgi:quercetin dioxygenase-like cupin family protein
MTDRPDDAPLLAALAGLGDEVRVRMRASILARAGAASVHAQRLAEGDWLPLLPGVTVKTLRRDERTQTTLWRVQPGGTVPGHVHSHEEECLILEGSIVHDGVEYFPGDFLLALPGERHKVFESPRGALFMIRGEPVPTPEALARYIAG